MTLALRQNPKFRSYKCTQKYILQKKECRQDTICSTRMYTCTQPNGRVNMMKATSSSYTQVPPTMRSTSTSLITNSFHCKPLCSILSYFSFLSRSTSIVLFLITSPSFTSLRFPHRSGVFVSQSSSCSPLLVVSHFTGCSLRPSISC